jgi:hypothetical protein
MPKKQGERLAGSLMLPGDAIARTLARTTGMSENDGSRSRQGSSFAARFGRVILKHGVAAIPSALYHFQGKLGLTAQQVWFTSYILSHKWDEDLPYPSIAQMALCTGLSDRMLRYRCNELHHLGYLEIYPRYTENGGQSTNYYDFGNLFARLEEIISGEAPPPNPIRERREGGVPAVPVDGTPVDSSFLARYGRVILSYGIAAVPRAIFTHQKVLGLTAQQVWFICYVLSFQWDTALPYPSINKMAERTAYSKQQLHTIKGELVAKGYLEIERRRAEGGGNDTNLYDFSALFDKIREHLEPDQAGATEQEAAGDGEPLADALADAYEEQSEVGQSIEEPGRRRHRPSQPKHARFTPAADASKSNPGNGAAAQLTKGAATEFTIPPATELPTPAARGLSREAAIQLSSQGKQASMAPLNRALPTGRKVALPKVETVKQEQIDQDDSNHLSPIKRKRELMPVGNAARPPYSVYIAQVITDFSNELGDGDHIVSNVTQALRLWQVTDLGEHRFVELLYEAKTRTRKYQSRPHSDALQGKMAYFFTVLRRLVEAAPDERSDVRPDADMRSHAKSPERR